MGHIGRFFSGRTRTFRKKPESRQSRLPGGAKPTLSRSSFRKGSGKPNTRPSTGRGVGP